MSSRTIRASATITLCVRLSQDGPPLRHPSPPHAGGEQTAEYQGGGTLAELKAHLAAMTDWANAEFPKPGGHNSIIELVNCTIVVD